MMPVCKYLTSLKPFHLIDKMGEKSFKQDTVAQFDRSLYISQVENLHKPSLPSLLACFTHIHSGHKWACFCSERGVLVPNVSLTPKSQCCCTANQQGNTFSPVSPACLEAPLSCQSHTSCQISEPFLLQVSLLCLLVPLKERGATKKTKRKKTTQDKKRDLACVVHVIHTATWK